MKQLFLIPFLVLNSGPAYAERATALEAGFFILIH
jgi:hypothetical protein